MTVVSTPIVSSVTSEQLAVDCSKKDSGAVKLLIRMITGLGVARSGKRGFDPLANLTPLVSSPLA